MLGIELFISFPAAIKLLNTDLYEWIGYLASVLVLVSLFIKPVFLLFT